MTDTERLAEATALLERCRNGFDWNQHDDPEQNEIGRRLEGSLSRAPAQPSPPHRSRAEVDAELAEAARDLGALYTRAKHERIDRLCRETTSGPGGESVDQVRSVRFVPRDHLFGSDDERPCPICHGAGFTHDCECQYPHSCKVCPAGARWEKERT